MGSHIIDEGWHNWKKPESEGTTEFAEYGSTGPGTSKRVSWAKQLTEEEAKQYSTEKVLAGKDGWQPDSAACNNPGKWL